MYSIVIPTIKPRSELQSLLKEIKATTVGTYEIIVTSDLEPNQPVSASINRNIGLKAAKYRFIIMIDDDISNLPNKWNLTLTDPLREERYMITSARLMNSDWTPGVMTDQSSDLTSEIVAVRQVPSACIAFRKKDVDHPHSIKFDEGIGSGFEDTDFNLQMKEEFPGREIVICNKVRVIHKNERKNQVGDNWIKNQQFFVKKWAEKLGGSLNPLNQVSYPIERKTISLCMIVKNEEANIADCIRSALPYVDEVIVLDTGSTDNTKSIVRSFDKVILKDYLWKDNFSWARNQATAHATKDWILFLDADERITKFDMEGVLAFMNIPVDFDFAYSISFVNDLKGGSVRHYMTRLFPNNRKFKYKGAIHERVVCADDSPAIVIPTNSIEVYHIGYTPSVVDEKRKAERNLALLYKALIDEPDSSLYLYHIGITYKMRGEYDKAAESFSRWVEVIRRGQEYEVIDHSGGFSAYLGTLTNLGRYEDALKLIQEFDSRCSHNPDWNFNAAQVCELTKNYPTALSCIERNVALQSKPIMTVSYDPDTLGWKMYALLGNLSSRAGNTQEAQAYWEKSLSLNPDNYAIVKALFTTYVKSRNIEKADLYFKQIDSLSREEDALDAPFMRAIYSYYLIKRDYVAAVSALSHAPDFNTQIKVYVQQLMQKGLYDEVVKIHQALQQSGVSYE